jgi:serine protease AprX
LTAAAAIAVLAPAAITAQSAASYATATPAATACDGAPVGIGTMTRPVWDGNAATLAAYNAAMSAYSANYAGPMNRDLAAFSNIGAYTYYNAGYYGRGVDVALIDSGVNTSVPGVDQGNVIQGPDFSFESQGGYGPNANPALQHTDTFGHGTHLASIIAGRDASFTMPAGTSASAPLKFPVGYYTDTNQFMGIAPLSRVISLKVADANGATDVTQVMAAVDWVIKHAHDRGVNIRVINLSYGLDPSDPMARDALSYVVEQAWQAGIVVVAAAGNAGRATSAKDPGLMSPAYTRSVLAIGALDANLSGANYSSGSSSKNMRLPDVSVPGSSLIGLHNPGSTEDTEIIDQCAKGMASPVLGPLWQGEGRFLKGSGTSQASALASGAIALMLSRNPELTPDGVKQLLRQTAGKVNQGSRRVTGEGIVNLAGAYAAIRGMRRPSQGSNPPGGGGTIENARGTIQPDGTNVTAPNDLTGPTGIVLKGNVDWMGDPINIGEKSSVSIMKLERVDPNHSPYCLKPDDWVAQAGYAPGGACVNGATTATMPTIMGYSTRVSPVTGEWELVETWNGGIVSGVGWGGVNSTPGVAPDKTLAPWNPTMWKAPAWLGPAGYVGTKWQQHRWTGMSWKTDDWSKAIWKSDGFLKLTWKDDSWSKIAWKDVHWG